MAEEQPTQRREGEAHVAAEGDGATLRDHVRQLATDSADLIRQEANLAKLEAKQTARELARDAAQVGIALGILAAGGLALTAFLVLVIGALLDGAYWAGALIVGGLFALIGGIMAKRAIDDLKEQDVKPEETIETIREDRRWAQREAQDFKKRVKGERAGEKKHPGGPAREA